MIRFSNVKALSKAQQYRSCDINPLHASRPSYRPTCSGLFVANSSGNVLPSWSSVLRLCRSILRRCWNAKDRTLLRHDWSTPGPTPDVQQQQQQQQGLMWVFNSFEAFRQRETVISKTPHLYPPLKPKSRKKRPPGIKSSVLKNVIRFWSHSRVSGTKVSVSSRDCPPAPKAEWGI